MHLTQRLTSLSLLYLLPLSLAEPFTLNGCNPNKAKALELLGISPSPSSETSLEFTEKHSTNETFADSAEEESFPALFGCQNCAKIKKKLKFKGGCDLAKNKGVLASHQCSNKKVGGKSYLCVRDGVAHCYRGEFGQLADGTWRVFQIGKGGW